MDAQTHRLFIDQLSHWASEIIQTGRSPFRKAETSPLLLTENGPYRPSMVFWINRDSFMAGGVLLCPPTPGEEVLTEGLNCVRALGLRHFVTWEAEEVVFWEETEQAPRRLKAIPLGGGRSDQAARFRQALGRIMEELKPLSVLGARNPAELPPHYFANLCLRTLDGIRPSLEESCRIAQGEGKLAASGCSAGSLAWHQSVLALVRLLALTAHDLLPTAIQPDRLERAMELALPNLPEELRDSCQPMAEEVPLPRPAAVGLHHLFCRLGQLRWHQRPQDASRAVEILLLQVARQIGGAPLPTDLQADGACLLVHPDRLWIDRPVAAQTAPPPLLAGLSLARGLAERQQSARGFTEVLAVPPGACGAQRICGTLIGSDDRPGSRDPKALSAGLRTSWPSRRFSLPRRTPRWTYELLHLLGVGPAEAEFDLAVPDDLLTGDFAGVLGDVIREGFTLTSLERLDERFLRIGLVKDVRPEQPLRLVGKGGERQLCWQEVLNGPWSLLSLALDLPQALFRLLEEGRLCPLGKALPDELAAGALLFLHTTAGRNIWQTLSARPAPPKLNGVVAAVTQFDPPLPPVEVLRQLESSFAPLDKELPERSKLDKELNRWLPLASQAPPPASLPRTRSPSSSPGSDPAELERMLFNTLETKGIPNFPDQYLYDHFRPDLKAYRYKGPLAMGEHFLGAFQLTDRDGRTLQVEGEETARALLLASFGHRQEVSLPTDRQLTAKILDRYLSELRQLHELLNRSAHAGTADPKLAKRLVNRVWKEKSLPPRELIKP